MYKIPDYSFKEEKKPLFTISPYFQNIPHRGAIIGQSGSGKTSCLPDILGHFIGPDTEIIGFVKNPNDKPYKRIKEYCRIKKVPCKFIDEFDPVLLEAGKDKSKHTIFIFDDVKLEKQDLVDVGELFSKGRQDNISSWFLSQDFYNRIPKTVRDNLNLIVSFKLASKDDFKRLSRSVGMEEPERMIKLYKHVTKEPYVPIIIYPDCGKREHLALRKGIDGILCKYLN